MSGFIQGEDRITEEGDTQEQAVLSIAGALALLKNMEKFG